MILLQVIFWTSIFLIIYTYLLFPAILELLASGKKNDSGTEAKGALPSISVLIAAFNEEEVIEAKIRSVAEADYPRDRIEILVGSDASTDGTNGILEANRG
jgi:cellulose synthase/poly-beta-1,6-N-acetylglucosamine synthase-like glycosyltransferase